MKTLVEITKKKIAVFTFGRMNPPTAGHEKLINKVLDVAHKSSATPFIFVSQTTDAKKNPLTSKQKIKYLRLGVPKAEDHISDNPSIKTPFQALEHLIELGYTDVIMVVGEDRVSEFKTSIGKYVNYPDKDKSFELDSFRVVSAGERDPDAEGTEGISGTKMRNFAASNQFTAFKKGVPSKLSDRFAKEMFDAIRKSMSLHEEVKFLKHTLNVPRKSMPQIKQEHMDEFIKFLSKRGINVSKRSIEVSSLKPTQSEINMNKVREKYEKFSAGHKEAKPFFVSYDSHILDGHHQLFALQALDDTQKVMCYVVGIHMKELLRYANSFPKTTYKNIDD